MLLCLTETNTFITVFQFYNKAGCPLQKKNSRNSLHFIEVQGSQLCSEVLLCPVVSHMNSWYTDSFLSLRSTLILFFDR